MSSQLPIRWCLQHSQEYHQCNHSWEPDSHSCDRIIELHSWKLNTCYTLALQYNTYNCLPLVSKSSPSLLQFCSGIATIVFNSNPVRRHPKFLLLPLSPSTIDPLVTPIAPCVYWHRHHSPTSTLGSIDMPLSKSSSSNILSLVLFRLDSVCRFDYIIVELPDTPVVPLVTPLPQTVSSGSTGVFIYSPALLFFLEPLAPQCVASCLFGPLALVYSSSLLLSLLCLLRYLGLLPLFGRLLRFNYLFEPLALVCLVRASCSSCASCVFYCGLLPLRTSCPC